MLTFAAPARAEAPYGLSMAGTPKYNAGDLHLEYVNPNAPKGGILRQAAIGTFDTLNPFTLKGTAAQGLQYAYDRLMARVWDEPFTLYPLIAQSIEVPADRSGMIVHINPDARFQDGTSITADDVIFTFTMLKEEGRANMRRVYKLVDRIEKIDPLTVSFKLGKEYDQETVMILAMMPVLSKAWWEKHSFNAPLLSPPISSGPYKVARVDPGRQIVLERDPDYWARDLLPNKGQYNFDTLVFDYYRDDSVAFEAFKAGQLDIRREYNASKWVSAYDFPAAKSGQVKTEAIAHARPERTRGLIFNTRRAPFDDIQVREALQYVLDFNWINRNLYRSQYKRLNSYFPNSYLAASGTPMGAELAVLKRYESDIPPQIFGPLWDAPAAMNEKDYRSNLKKADELLKKAGWSIENGVRTKDGTPFKFEILLNAPEDEKIALSFINGLKRLGIHATTRVLDNAAFVGRLNEFDYDMMLHYWQNSLSPGTEQLLYWGCDGRFNYAGICNRVIDDLSRSLTTQGSQKDIQSRVHALDRLLIWGHYMIPLYYTGNDYIAYRHDIQRPPTTPMYGVVLESWWSEP